MRKTLSAAIAMLFAFVCMSLPAAAVPSGQHGALHADLTLTWSEPPGYWWGGLTGDINGMATYLPDYTQTGRNTGVIGHFYENFTICFGLTPTPTGCNPPTGSYIIGKDHGVYNIQPDRGKWHFMASGWVTGASSDLAYLIGYKYHENGWTTSPYDPVTYGEGTVLLASG